MFHMLIFIFREILGQLRVLIGRVAISGLVLFSSFTPSKMILIVLGRNFFAK